jgi:hypothetical protein
MIRFWDFMVQRAPPLLSVLVRRTGGERKGVEQLDVDRGRRSKARRKRARASGSADPATRASGGPSGPGLDRRDRPRAVAAGSRREPSVLSQTRQILQWERVSDRPRALKFLRWGDVKLPV